MTLNSEQLRAVTRSGQDVCVTAGPGSGKTRVLVERFAWLVRQGCPPQRILAITFTEKAAAEIKKRLVREFASDERMREQIERAYISTIHGFCARLLKENAIAAGIDPDFKVLDEREAAMELASAMEAALDEAATSDTGRFRSLAGGLTAFDLPGAIVNAYEARRTSAGAPAQGVLLAAGDWDVSFQSLCDPVEQLARTRPSGWTAAQLEAFGRLREWAAPVLALRDAEPSLEHFRALAGFKFKLNDFKTGPVRELVRNVREEFLPSARRALASRYYRGERETLNGLIDGLDRIYRDRKRAAASLDFSDLEEQALELLRSNEPVREAVRNGFEAVLMDELQDTNPVQWAVVDLLRTPYRFFGVGDINQSIYGFRHAAPHLFRGYRASVERQGVLDRLDENHRSRREVLAAARLIMRDAAGIESPELRAARAYKPKDEPSVELIVAFDDDRELAQDLEASLVARRIRQLAGTLLIESGDSARTAGFGDIAVLLRAADPMTRFERAFREQGIPYTVSRGKGFFESQEVTDLIHLLRVIDNPRNEIALAAVLRSPLAAADDETLLDLKRGGGNLGAAVAGSGDPRVSSFRPLLERLRRRRDDVSPDRLLAAALDESGYPAGLGSHQRANVEKLLSMLRDAHATRPRALSAVLESLDALRALGNEAEAVPAAASGAVQLMTIHAAKGLEFPVVFVATLHRQLNFMSGEILYSPETGFGARWRDPATGDAIADTIHHRLDGERKTREAEESDRLLYVAMTRAEQHLVLSFADTGQKPQYWAKRVGEALGLSLSGPLDDPAVISAPGFDFLLHCCDEGSAERGAAQAAGEPAGDIEALAPIVAAGQHDSAAAVTSVALFASCPRRYYLERYLGYAAGLLEHRPDSGVTGEPPAGGAEFGTEVHAALAGLPGRFSPAALELAERFRLSPLGVRASRASRIEREYDFVLAVGGMVLNGQIDLWFEEAGELVLADYKTGLAGKHDESYGLQLQIYALALERALGRPPDRAVLFYLRTGLEVDVDLSREALAGAERWIARLKAAQSAMDFPAAYQPACESCPYRRGLCPLPPAV